MYRYDEFDQKVVDDRVKQFTGQVKRRLSGALTEDEFRPLRLMNGLYLQLHAYMLRVAIPYGTLSSEQMRTLADIADDYDRGYGHFTTRQNIQFNWPKLADVPEILEVLAGAQMHAIQTSGNCIRNVTTDQFAGAAGDEVEDPRPLCELLRQWSTFHPEFTFLPRKFKIAVTAAEEDRAAIRFHDIGIQIVKNDAGETGCHIFVGGGLGRTPIVGQSLNAFVPNDKLLAYLEAVMRVYNRYGRRDNKYKARIKILVTELGLEEFREQVEAEYATLDAPSIDVGDAERARIAAYFAAPPFEELKDEPRKLRTALATKPGFASWHAQNTHPHYQPGYINVTISLKPRDGAPGDISSDQMRAVAKLAERFSLSEIRSTHEQNLVLAHVRQDELLGLYEGLVDAGLAADNAGLISDIICCPGLDYCALATARSIPVSQAIAQRFEDPTRQKAIGEMKIKISGCINACGHHHVGHIGILGLEKAGVEFYQVTLGGDATQNAYVGDKTGKGFSQDELVDGIERMVDFYLDKREGEERFVDSYKRLGLDAFKEVLYADD